MAIYGVGSIWDGQELASSFFQSETFKLGWDEKSAEDLYSFLASLKAGDILYLKANRPGSRTIRIKGIGFVKESFIASFRGKKGRYQRLSKFFTSSGMGYPKRICYRYSSISWTFDKYSSGDGI